MLAGLRKQSTVQTLQMLSLVCMLSFFSGGAAADDDYSQGLTSYIQGDYEVAQEHWLRSAKAKNPKAMFNLGILHEQGKIGDADQVKAERWFKLAGQAGYAAADYHYANRLINRGAPQTEVARYLRRSAGNGFYPAKALLSKILGGDRLATLSPKQLGELQELEKIDTALELEDTSDQVRYLTEDWIKTRMATGWTIQMLAFKEEAKVREFIDEHELHRSAAYFVEHSGDGDLYKLVYGSYSSKALADQARNSLAPALRAHGPWLRTLASVQKIIASQ